MTEGHIIIPRGLNVWPHELNTAQALAADGHNVEFVKKSNAEGERTADIVMDGLLWEMKAPTASHVQAIERNIRRACLQSENVILDARRMRSIPPYALEREARACVKRIAKLKRLIFIDRTGRPIDIL